MNTQVGSPSTDVSADTFRAEPGASATPRQTRLRLNKMERWFRTHAERFTPEDRVFLRLAFEYAERGTDADVIAKALMAGVDGTRSGKT